jgi:hypothetical protein
MVVGCGLFAAITASTGYSALWPSLVLIGIGVGVTMSQPSAAALRSVRADEAGEASGLLNVARYFGAALAVAAGTLVFTAAGSADLNRVLGGAGVPQLEERKLDTTLTGSQAHFKAAAADLDDSAAAAFHTGAAEGIAGGFAAVMLALGVVSAAAGVLWIVLMRNEERDEADPA